MRSFFSLILVMMWWLTPFFDVPNANLLLQMRMVLWILLKLPNHRNEEASSMHIRHISMHMHACRLRRDGVLLYIVVEVLYIHVFHVLNERHHTESRLGHAFRSCGRKIIPFRTTVATCTLNAMSIHKWHYWPALVQVDRPTRRPAHGNLWHAFKESTAASAMARSMISFLLWPSTNIWRHTCSLGKPNKVFTLPYLRRYFSNLITAVLWYVHVRQVPNISHFEFWILGLERCNIYNKNPVLISSLCLKDVSFQSKSTHSYVC